MISLRALPISTLLIAAAGGACSPQNPTPVPDPGPGVSYQATIRIVSALDLQAGLPQVTVSVAGGTERQTDGTGVTVIETTTPSTVPLRLRHPAFVERETSVKVPADGQVDLSLIPSTIDLAAFEEFAPRTAGLRRWTRNPALVVLNHAVDFSGATPDFLEYPVTSRRISDAQLDCLASGVASSLEEMSGGRLGWSSVEIQAVEPGSRFRTNQTPEGTIVALPSVALVVGGRGTAYIGNEPFVLTRGAVWLNAETTQNFCLSSLIYRHELGHALGYQHVTRTLSIMSFPGLPQGLTDFDRNVTAILFQRPPGNLTPDRDPATFPVNVVGRAWPPGEPMR